MTGKIDYDKVDMSDPAIYHFIVDEDTDRITFKKDHKMYRIERDAFAAHGIDIDKIETATEYDRCFRIARYTIRDIMYARARERARQPGNLGGQFSVALYEGRFDDMKRIAEKIAARKRLSIVEATDSSES